MGKQLFIGLAVEGNTDMRFLKSIVQRTFNHLVFDLCDQDIDIDVFEINVSKVGKSFREFVASASLESVRRYGVLVLAVHSDSDKESLQQRLEDKFLPARDYLSSLDENAYCKILVPIIPMRMVEAWMMADTQLLREEMGTDMTDSELGLLRPPEDVADPKELIENAIRIVQNALPKKRRTLAIGDLYEILGYKISYESLYRLSSFRAFVSACIDALQKIHYLPVN